jgi:hypothetical protein
MSKVKYRATYVETVRTTVVFDGPEGLSMDFDDVFDQAQESPDSEVIQYDVTDRHCESLVIVSPVETPEAFLNKRASRCGLNADWSAQAWHLGPSACANMHDGDYYIVDLEDNANPYAFALMRRFHAQDDDENDEILTIAEGDAETMFATASIIFKQGATL